MIRIRQIETSRAEICNVILRKLPDWFGIESAIVNYVKDASVMPMLVADFGEDHDVGFLSLNFHNEFNSEIHVMGILPQFQGRGIGTALVEAAENLARSRKVRYLTVKTVSGTRPSREYDLTRKFYASTGFLPLEEFKTLWGEANPCLLMIKSL